MKVTQDEVVDRQTTLNIELEEDDLDTYLERGYRKLVGQINIPGFRKGKAPRRIVESFVGRENILAEVLDVILPDATVRAIADQKLESSGPPQYDLQGLDPLSFTATVALKPNVDLGDYRSVEVPVVKVEVSDENVDTEIDRLREQMALWEPMDKASRIGDMVSINMVAKAKAKTFIDEKGVQIVLDSENDGPLPGLSEKLIGLSADDESEFEIEMPEDYRDEDVAGAVATFNVIVTGVKQKTLPDLDDEFAHTVGDGHESLGQLREEVKTNLKLIGERNETQRVRDAVVEGVVGTATVELPPLLLEHEIGHLKEDRERTFQQLGISMDNYFAISGTTQEQMDEQIQEEARARLNRTFVLEKVSELENLVIVDEEVEEKLDNMIGGSKKKLTNRQRRELKSEESKTSIRRSLLIDKTVDLLVESARVDNEPKALNEGSTEHTENEPETEG